MKLIRSQPALVAVLSILLGLLSACAPEEKPGSSRQVTPTQSWSEAKGSEARVQPAATDAEKTHAEDDPLVDPATTAFWRARTGGEVWSSPALESSGRVFFGSDDRQIYALDSRDGSELWKAKTEGRVRRAPVRVRDQVLIVDEQGTFYAFAADSGEQRWRRSLPKSSYKAWAAHKKRLVHGGPKSPLVSRSTQNGNVQWQHQLDEQDSGVRAVNLDAERVYAITEAGRVLCLDSRQGQVQWSAELKLDTRSSPIPYGNHLLLVGNGFLWSLDARTGHEQWRTLTHEFVSASPELVSAQGSPTVLVAGGDILFAFDLHRGHELWRQQLEGAFRSGPRSLGDWVLVGSGEHLLTAFDLKSGHERWRFETDAFITAALSVHSHPIRGDRVLFGGVGGALYGVSLVVDPQGNKSLHLPPPLIRVGPTFFDGTPQIRWQRRLDTGKAAPIVEGDQVIQLSASRLAGLSLDRGEVRWKYKLKKAGTPSPVPPVVTLQSNRIILADAGRLQAISLDQGKAQWSSPKTDRAKLRLQAMSLSRERLLVGTADGQACLFNPQTGDRLWNRSLGSPITGRPSAGESVVFFSTTEGSLFALDAETGRELWSAKAPGSLPAGSLLDSDALYIGDATGIVHAFDPMVGGERWTSAVGGSFRLAPATTFGTIFWCGDDGSLFALDALTGAEAWRLPIGERCTGAPQIHDGIVYVGSQDRSLHAINAVNGEELWRLHMAAPVIGSGLGIAPDGRAVIVATDRSGQIVAVDLP